jgi:trans-aconitate 2-methyltransferase
MPSTSATPESTDLRSNTHWNPGAYLTYASERTQPFIDLLTHVGAPGVRSIVDLGCGPGNGMPILRAMWPDAWITGVDSSAEMIERAESTTQDDRISYVQADIRGLSLEGTADLVVSNAALQWLPDHREVLPDILNLIAPGGTLAVQIPGNFSAPSHQLLADLAAREPYASHIDPGTLLQPTAELVDYMHDLARPGVDIEAWETRYHHILQGEDPVFTWISAAAARPVLSALPEPIKSQFVEEYKAALREAYPRAEMGTILPFRRLFFIARKD